MKQGGLTRSLFPKPECIRGVGEGQLDYRMLQILTGHSFLKYHLYLLGYSVTPLCSFGESVDHFLFHCCQFRDKWESFLSMGCKPQLLGEAGPNYFVTS